jgi:hypothetical protein
MAPNSSSVLAAALVTLATAACSSGEAAPGSTLADGAPAPTTTPPTNPERALPAGYPDGHASVPTEGQAEDVSNPTTVIGTGTPDSCTGAAFVAAVAKGGGITFDCGADPVTIVLTETAKVFNDKGTKLVIDGGNKVTLSGGGKVRILYMATCDKAQVYPPGPGDCNTNPGVELAVQNITFIDGNAKGIPDGTNNSGGGGAIHAQGGSLKVVNARFFNNVCDDLGSDVGGGAIRKLDYLVDPGAGPARPAWVVNSTFGGGTGLGNSCANGGALSVGVVEHHQHAAFENTAVGHGRTAARAHLTTATIVLNVTSSLIENNRTRRRDLRQLNKTGSITIRTRSPGTTARPSRRPSSVLRDCERARADRQFADLEDAALIGGSDPDSRQGAKSAKIAKRFCLRDITKHLAGCLALLAWRLRNGTVLKIAAVSTGIAGPAGRRRTHETRVAAPPRWVADARLAASAPRAP